MNKTCGTRNGPVQTRFQSRRGANGPVRESPARLKRSSTRVGQTWYCNRAYRKQLGNAPAVVHARQPKRRSSRWRATTTVRRVLHSLFSGLSDIGAERSFAGVALDEMRRPGARGLTHIQHPGVENVSGSFDAQREPQQYTRFGPPHDKSFSRSKDGTCLMRPPRRSL
jgi:hypothetical protein